MDPVDENADGYDPNEPDCTNGDFFCRLCLSSQNSDTMWSQHIAGKRHIKNAQKYPKGLPTREKDFIDEDSYERPPMRERFDDGYDLHNDYPTPMYKHPDEYYGEDYYKQRALLDYTPAVKPNIVIDYAHSKELVEAFPPTVIKKSPAVPPVSRPLPASSPVDFQSVLEQLLPKSSIEKDKLGIKDDFFEKINQREMAKELAKELAKKSMSLDSLEPGFNTSEKKDFGYKTSSAHDNYDKYDKRKPDILDEIYESNEKKRKHDDERDSEKMSSSYYPEKKSSSLYENNEKKRSEFDDKRNFGKKSYDEKKRSGFDDRRDFDKRNSSYENEKRPPRRYDERDSEKRSSSYENEKRPPRRYDDRYSDRRSSSYKSNDMKRSRLDDDKRDSEKRSSSNKNNDMKKSRLDDDKKDSEKKNSSSSLKKSSAGSKSELDDLDPDELTPDILDSLLSARLKPKKNDSLDEICNKKHCVKNIVDLNDPKVIAEKIQSLSTMEFLNIVHKKIVSLDLKTPEELKMLLTVIAEAQGTVCKKLPPELQNLVKSKLSSKDAANSQPPAQNPVVSQAPAATSSNVISKNSITAVSFSSQATVPVNPAPKQPVFPASNIPVSLNQGSIPTVSSAAISQNQIPLSCPSSVVTTIPTTTPMRMAAPPPPPLINAAPVNRAASLQTNPAQNYYDMLFSMYQNRPLAQPVVPNMLVNQQVPATSRFSLPPPPPPPPPSFPPRPQMTSNEILNVVAQLQNQSQPRPQIVTKEILNAVAKLQSQTQPRPQMVTKEMLDAVAKLQNQAQPRPQIVTKEMLDAVAKLKNQAQQPVAQPKQQTSASNNSQPQTKEEILTALRNLDILQEEYKRRKAQKSSNENKNSTSEKPKSNSYKR